MIRSIVDAYWGEGVEAMALELCRRWSWRVSGRPCVGRAERLLVGLASRDLIDLPIRVPARGAWSRPPDGPTPEVDTTVIAGPLSALPAVELRLVDSEELDSLFDHLLWTYHYLGLRRVIGEHLKYLAMIGERPVAALLWGRAALKVRARDTWIGWSAQERRRGLGRVANNYRFLVVPWVHVRNLASHVLAATMRRIPADWWRGFGQSLEYLETFVDPHRFGATCYLAANWLWVGYTAGSGRRGPRYHYHGHRKMVLLYPLSKKLRRLPRGAPPKEVIRTPLRSPRLSLALPKPVEGVERMDGDRKESEDRLLVGLESLESEVLPQELSDYCGQFHELFPRPRACGNLEVAMGGLLSGLEKKNAEFIALRGGNGVPVRTFQYFIGASPWSDKAVRIRHQELVAETLGHPEGVLIVDGSDFPKKGDDSAGVARQYCGATGKVDNCQAGVFVAYASAQGATLVDAQLYMPSSWFTEEQRRQRWEACHIPRDLEFRTKPELALEMIREVHARGRLSADWVLGDEAFGDNPAFLDGIPEGLHYFCEVGSKTRVALPGPPSEDGAGAGLPILEVRQLLDQVPLEWQLGVVLKEGAHGPLVADVARLRVREVRRQGRQSVPAQDVWLFLRRHPGTGEVKFFLSNAPEDTSMEKMSWLSAMRWPIETCFQEGKDHLGMDHYQVRSWTGWHHHMTLVMLSHHFLIRVGTRLKRKRRS